MVGSNPSIVKLLTPYVLEGPNTLLFEVKDFLTHVGNASISSRDSGAEFKDVTAQIQAAGSSAKKYLTVTANVSYDPGLYSSTGDLIIIIDTYDEDPPESRTVTKIFGTSPPKITYLRDAIHDLERVS